MPCGRPRSSNSPPIRPTFVLPLHNCSELKAWTCLGNLCRGCGYEGNNDERTAKQRAAGSEQPSRISPFDCTIAGNASSLVESAAGPVGDAVSVRAEPACRVSAGYRVVPAFRTRRAHAAAPGTGNKHGRRALELL